MSTSGEYITPEELRRGAVWTLHTIRGDHAAARMVAGEGPIDPMAVFRACTVASAELWLDPEAAAERVQAHVQSLVRFEHGLVDGGDNG